MITQLARSDGLALRARRPRAVGTGRTEELKSECDETSYTYQQDCITLGSGGSGQSPEAFTESIAIQEIPYVGVFRLNNGVTVGGSTTGLTSIASGGQDTGISLGSVYSSPSVGASSNSYKVNGSSEPDTVLISPALIAPSGADQIWFVPAQGIAEVGLVDFS
jgi:hypothetical protein